MTGTLRPARMAEIPLGPDGPAIHHRRHGLIVGTVGHGYFATGPAGRREPYLLAVLPDMTVTPVRLADLTNRHDRARLAGFDSRRASNRGA